MALLLMARSNINLREFGWFEMSGCLKEGTLREIRDRTLMVIGYWLMVIGYWLLIV